MNFSNIHDFNNHWIYAISICAVEAALALPLAWYLEQVLPSGTGHTFACKCCWITTQCTYTGTLLY